MKGNINEIGESFTKTELPPFAGHGTFVPAGGTHGLYNVNLITGAASLIGIFPKAVQIADVALDTN